MEKIGVSRVAEVTHLDRNGIPNFIAARPREAGEGISYYNGKGASKSQARASAMMEAIERYSGEFWPCQPLFTSYEKLARERAAVDPEQLIVPRLTKYDRALEIEWIEGFDLVSRQTRFVPLNSVVFPYIPQRGKTLFYSSTNGLASGNTREEALCQALCEVNERDAFSLYDAATTLKGQVRALLVGESSQKLVDAARSDYPVIDPRTLPVRARRIYERLAASGLTVYLRDVTSETRIATFMCLITMPQGAHRHLVHGGYGCHPDARVAAVRSLTEAAQSRVSFIQGGREDLPDLVQEITIDSDPDQAFGSGPQGDFASVPTVENKLVGDDVSWIVERFNSVGLTQVVAIDLTRPELGVPVVRVVVPGAECWSLFQVHLSRSAIGARALARTH
jgi:ribosomal protein S12 methylthiotransferase accessory factor